MPRLIINADDFGLTSGVNRAIEEGARAGAITSATLMAVSQRFEEAAKIATRLPSLKIGCHVVLVDGESISAGLESLTNGGSKFRNSLSDFAIAVLRGRIAESEIQQEAEAQIRKIQSSGISLTHVDTHKHTHIFPGVLRPVLKAAKACGIHAVRNPFGPVKLWFQGRIAMRPGLWKRVVEVGLLQRFAHKFQHAVRSEGIITTEGTTGIVVTGSLDQAMLLATLDGLPNGTWELVCHPGYMDADLKAVGTRLLESRRIELDALLSTDFKHTLAKRGIELISYADLGSVS